jgi:uncharacterized membrane protein
MQYSWIFLAILPPLLWAMTNHIDKFLVTRYGKDGDVYGLIVVSAIAGVVVFPIIPLFVSGVFALSFGQAFSLIFSGFLYVLALLFYFKAFSYTETSKLVILYNTIPLFTFILGFLFLGETLTFLQIAGGLIILSGASLLSLGLDEGGKFNWHFKPIVLMLVASFFFASFFFLFKKFALDLDFWPAMFWQYAGWFIIGTFLLFIPKFRRSFLRIFSRGRSKFLGINVFNELLNVGGVLIANSVYLIAPIALVSVTIQGLQSIFSIVLGVLMTLFLPNMGKERITFSHIGFKMAALSVILIGVVIVSLF